MVISGKWVGTRDGDYARDEAGRFAVGRARLGFGGERRARVPTLKGRSSVSSRNIARSMTESAGMAISLAGILASCIAVGARASGGAGCNLGTRPSVQTALQSNRVGSIVAGDPHGVVDAGHVLEGN